MVILLLLVAVYSNAQTPSSDDEDVVLDRSGSCSSWELGKLTEAIDEEIDSADAVDGSGVYNSLFFRKPKSFSVLLDEEESEYENEQIETIYSRQEQEAKQKEEQEKILKRRQKKQAERNERRLEGMAYLRRAISNTEPDDFSLLEPSILCSAAGELDE
jgi:hypothetical protein